MKVYPNDRYKYILDKLNINNKVTVSELAKELNISEVTVRKDLNEMESRGLLKRTFGGAVKLKYLANRYSYDERENTNIDNKKKIAEKASDFLGDGLNIFLDAGTTIKELVPYLFPYKNLTVITYDLKIALELAGYPHIKTIVLGGLLENETLCAFNLDTYKILNRYRADIAFLGCDAFDVDGAYTVTDVKMHLKNTMVKNSKISILLADSSKYNKQSLSVFANFNEFDYFITDVANEKIKDFKKKISKQTATLLFSTI